MAKLVVLLALAALTCHATVCHDDAQGCEPHHARAGVALTPTHGGAAAAAGVSIGAPTQRRVLAAALSGGPGQLRLMRFGADAGAGPGRLEVLAGDGATWGTVCDDTPSARVSSALAATACRLLGHPPRTPPATAPLTVKGAALFPDWTLLNASLPILASNVACNGTEAAIGDCAIRAPYCTHVEDVWLDCAPPLLPPITLRLTVNGTDAGAGPGRLEVGGGYPAALPGGGARMGTVCIREWTDADTAAACEQMGFPASSTARRRAFLGSNYPFTELAIDGTDSGLPILLGDSACTGGEATFADCADPTRGGVQPVWGGHNCYTTTTTNSLPTVDYHFEDVWLNCAAPPLDAPLRLNRGDGAGAPTAGPGRLEVYLRGEWSTVCSSLRWTQANTNAACGSMGYARTQAGAVVVDLGKSFSEYEVVGPAPSLVNASAPMALGNVHCDVQGDNEDFRACNSLRGDAARCAAMGATAVWLDCEAPRSCLVVSTVAGEPFPLSNQPEGLVVDAATGDVFMADVVRKEVLRLANDGTLSTLAGGLNQEGRFIGAPTALARLPDGRLLSAADENFGLYVIDPVTGGVEALTGRSSGLVIRVGYPSALAVDAGSSTIFVAETYSHSILTVSFDTRDDEPLLMVGSGMDVRKAGYADGTGVDARFWYPRGLAHDPSTSTLYVADTGNRVIRAVAVATRAVSTFAGVPSQAGYTDGGRGVGLFQYPQGLALLGGALYVADVSCVRRVSLTDGAISTLAGGGDSFNAQVDGIGRNAYCGLVRAVTPGGAGALFAADAVLGSVRRIVPATASVTTVVSPPSGLRDGLGYDARLKGPRGVAWDTSTGDLIVADTANNAIRRLTRDGVLTTVAGTGSVGSNDGPSDRARFWEPRAVAVRPNGDVVVADTSNYVVRLILVRERRVSTLAGTGEVGDVDGEAAAATFGVIAAVAVLDAATVFVLDASACRLRAIGGGRVWTVAGSGVCTSADGVGAMASFDTSRWGGLAADPRTGALFVLEVGTAAVVRRVAPAHGNVTTYAGHPDAGCGPLRCFTPGVGTAAGFHHVVLGMAYDNASGVLYLSDEDSVYAVTPEQAVSRIADVRTSGIRDGLSSYTALRADALAVDGFTRALYAVHTSASRVARVDTIPDLVNSNFGSQCYPLNEGLTACAPGNRLDWTTRACNPCPAGSTPAGPFATYCLDTEGRTLPLVLPLPLPPPLAVGDSGTTAVVAVLVCLAITAGLAMRAWQIRQRAQRLTAANRAVVSAVMDYLGPQTTSSGVRSSSGDSSNSTMNPLRVSSGSASPGGGPAPQHIPISWDDLRPDPAARPLSGGFGVVFSATWVSRAKRVAVKVPKVAVQQGMLPPQDVAALLGEARGLLLAMDRGANDHVVKLYGVAVGQAGGAWPAACARAKRMLMAAAGSGGGATLALPGLGAVVDAHDADVGAGAAVGPPCQLLGLVMTWEERGALRDALFPAPGSGRVPWPTALPDRLRICAEIATGLLHLHNVGLVHGDMKSENVLLSGSLEARLTDFGLAAVLDAAGSGAGGAGTVPSRLSTMRVADEKRGTWLYMAPEMYGGEGPGAAPPAAASRSTDVFALGTLLWEVLTGRNPWAEYSGPGGEAARLAALRAGGALPDTRKVAPDVPVEVAALVAACMADNRATRPRMSEVHAELMRAHAVLQSRRFDVFLSNAWGPARCRRPLTLALYDILTAARLRVWLDSNEMGYDIDTSMVQGIANSDVVVVLVSPHYVSSRACMFELRAAAGVDAAGARVGPSKPIVAAVVEPGMGDAWSPGPELAALARLGSRMYADLSAAAGVAAAGEGGGGNGEGGGALPAEAAAEALRAALTQHPEATQRLLKLVEEARATVLANSSSNGSSGSSGRASDVSASTAVLVNSTGATAGVPSSTGVLSSTGAAAAAAAAATAAAAAAAATTAAAAFTRRLAELSAKIPFANTGGSASSPLSSMGPQTPIATHIAAAGGGSDAASGTPGSVGGGGAAMRTISRHAVVMKVLVSQSLGQVRAASSPQPSPLLSTPGAGR